jgi:hypothetical protein
VLQHEDGWRALSITAAPQTMELVLTNRTARPVRAAPALVSLRFRPGVLDALDALRLAAQSEASWALAVTEDAEGVLLTFAGVERPVVEPGDPLVIRLDGMSAAEAGGSRASRVALQYAGFHHEDGVEVAGARQLHLPILRSHAPAGLPARDLRSGSVARAGPFEAGFVGSAGVINDGLSANDLVLRVVNIGGAPLPLWHGSDAATRFQLSYETGPLGALATPGDRLKIEGVTPRGWDKNHHTLRRDLPGPWARDAVLDIALRLHTSALSGRAQLILRYENLPGHDDGELVLLIDLGSMAERQGRIDVVRPLVLRGETSALRFEPGDVEGREDGAEKVPVSSFWTSEVEATLGELNLTVPAGLSIDGELAHPHLPRRRRGSFTIGGQLNRYYPVIFRDDDWSHGPMHLNLWRHYTHTDEKWRGTLQLDLRCHSPNWGHGSDFFELRARQNKARGSGFTRKGVGHFRRFVGGFENHAQQPAAVLWLAGHNTYFWRSEQPARLVNAHWLSDPGEVYTYPETGSSNAQRSFKIKTAPEEGFGEPYIHIERSFGQDTAAVPRGTIVMWSGKADEIPLGWALCDNKGGRPDLINRFVMGAGPDTEVVKGEPDRHTHRISGQTVPTTAAGSHQHRMPKNWRSMFGGFGPIPTQTFLEPVGLKQLQSASSVKVQSAGEHRHSVTTRDVESGSSSGLNRPKWYALCYIIKL